MHKKSIQIVKDFNSWINTVEKDYQFYFNEVSKLDNLTNDILHRLELEQLSYSERAKLATKLSNTRRERRYYKDLVQQLQPVIDYLQDQQSRKVIMNFSTVLGKLKDVESVQQHRTYRYRVLELRETK